MAGDDAEDNLHGFDTPDEALAYLRYAGTLDDADIDIAETVLALALVFLPGVHVDRYRQHLKKLCDQVKQEHASRLRMKEKDTARMRVQVLRKILHEAHDYRGDDQTYDDLQNINMIRVIERRRGLPVALGLLYVITARAQGWRIEGLNFPAHFLLRVEEGGQRLILDPFRQGVEMNAADLRALLKSRVGENAELAHDYYNAVTTRNMLLRLQNNLKARLVETEDYAQAILVIETMEALAPHEYRTLFDKAVLYVKVGEAGQAMNALQDYIDKTPHPREKQYAAKLLEDIRNAPSLPRDT